MKSSGKATMAYKTPKSQIPKQVPSRTFFSLTSLTPFDDDQFLKNKTRFPSKISTVKLTNLNLGNLNNDGIYRVKCSGCGRSGREF